MLKKKALYRLRNKIIEINEEDTRDIKEPQVEYDKPENVLRYLLEDNLMNNFDFYEEFLYVMLRINQDEVEEVLGTLREKYPEEFYNVLGDYLGEDPKYLTKNQCPEVEYSYRILKHMKEEYATDFDTELSTYTGRNMMLYWVSPVEQETLLLGLDVYGEDLWFVESEQ